MMTIPQSNGFAPARVVPAERPSPPSASSPAEATSAPASVPAPGQVKQAVQMINKAIQTFSRNLEFSFDDAAVGKTVVKVVDKETGDMIRQIPSEETLAIARALAYEPEVGWFEQVGEYDFVSMYPTLMVQANVSPETVNCACCPDNKVPEIGHHLCRRREGLVPKVLKPILEKRARYKALALKANASPDGLQDRSPAGWTAAKSGGPDAAAFKARANAHKWILVCCFGYLGFKNARFGKIEAHECVTALGRDALLKAKEIVEGRGLRLLHALVDAVWVTGVGPVDWEQTRLAIEAGTGCRVGLEGVYNWLRFCPSKRDALSGVPGRYFGAFTNGELKIRGIASRRRDTPKLLKDLQGELLGLMARAPDLAALRALSPQLAEIAEDYRYRLREGQVTAADLAITFNLSKEPGEYVHDTVATLAARQLQRAGARLHPGETVRYVITSAKDKVKDWRARPLALMEGALDYDPKKYLELLERAVAEVLEGL